MDGAATWAIVESSRSITEAVMTAANASQRRGCGMVASGQFRNELFRSRITELTLERKGLFR
jgi:hypothetical protein